MISMKSYEFLGIFHRSVWTPRMAEHHYVEALDTTGDSNFRKLHFINCPSIGNTVFFKTAVLITCITFCLEMNEKLEPGFNTMIYNGF